MLHAPNAHDVLNGPARPGRATPPNQPTYGGWPPAGGGWGAPADPFGPPPVFPNDDLDGAGFPGGGWTPEPPRGNRWLAVSGLLAVAAVATVAIGTSRPEQGATPPATTPAAPTTVEIAQPACGAPLDTPYIATGCACPEEATAMAGASTTLEHRYLSTNWHALACTTGSGNRFLYIEDRSLPTRLQVLPAARSGAGYVGTSGPSRIDVDTSGLRASLYGNPLTFEPIVLER